MEQVENPSNYMDLARRLIAQINQQNQLSQLYQSSLLQAELLKHQQMGNTDDMSTVHSESTGDNLSETMDQDLDEKNENSEATESSLSSRDEKDEIIDASTARIKVGGLTLPKLLADGSLDFSVGNAMDLWENNNQQRLFKCDLCFKAFTQAGNLKRHMRNVHEGRKDFECNECKKKFKQLQSLKVHKKCVHLGLREFLCTLCGKQCSTKSSLKSHIINNHSTEPILKKNTKVKCDLCANVFCHSGSLKRHMRTVHEGRSDFECDECNKRFKSYQSMKIHKKCVHQGRRDFTCGECGRQLCTKSSLRTHIRNSHPNLDLTEVENRSIINSNGEELGQKMHKVHQPLPNSLPTLLNPSTIFNETPTLLKTLEAVNYASLLRQSIAEPEHMDDKSDDEEEDEEDLVIDEYDEDSEDARNKRNTELKLEEEEESTHKLAITEHPQKDSNDPFILIPLSVIRSLPTEEIIRQLNQFKNIEQEISEKIPVKVTSNQSASIIEPCDVAAK